MFQLNIKREFSELSYVFDQPRLVLGSKGAPPVDLTLSDSALLPVHLIIFRRGKDYYAENVGQDPHTRVSGVPFWKKRLKSGDTISLGNSTITFFQLASPARPEDEEGKGESPLALSPPRKETYSSEPQKELAEELSLKDSSLRETNLIERLSPEHQESPLHVWLLLAGLVLIFTTLFGLALTLTMREKSEEQRVVAAAELADLGMLLTYAQIYGLEPTHQNFLDPEFLRSIGPKVLKPPFSEIGWIDKEGHLEGADYLIRIYSDGDLSRFILLAQPEHHFFQWLVPSWTLILDSEEMIIRATQDLKELNRLLVEKVGGLEGEGLALVTQKIQETEEIPLIALSDENGKNGFRPPEELSYVNPKGGFYIYNAPRYYLFSQPIIEMVHSIKEAEDISQKFHQEIALRARFPLMIFYTTLGIESAIDARKLFSGDLHSSTHLIGYLDLDEEGGLLQSHLLMMGHRHANVEAEGIDTLPESTPLDPLTTYKEHPLFSELQTLLEKRKDRLESYHEPLVAVLEEHLIHTDRQFFLRYNSLFDAFQDALKREQAEIDQAVNTLCNKYVFENGELSVSLFSTILDLAGVEVGYEEGALSSMIRPILTLHPNVEQLENLFAEVQKASSIPVLDQAIAMAHELLNQEILPDPQVLNSWQTGLRSLAIYKLETLLWVSQTEGDEPFDREELRWMIGRILRNGYITESDKREFYLSQVDLDIGQKIDETLLLSSDL